MPLSLATLSMLTPSSKMDLRIGSDKSGGVSCSLGLRSNLTDVKRSGCTGSVSAVLIWIGGTMICGTNTAGAVPPVGMTERLGGGCRLMAALKAASAAAIALAIPLRKGTIGIRRTRTSYLGCGMQIRLCCPTIGHGLRGAPASYACRHRGPWEKIGRAHV